MHSTQGAGSEGAGPFSFAEPLGLLHGAAARAAVELGIGLPFAGGPGVFSMVRHGDGVLPAVEARDHWPGLVLPLTVAGPDWAGLGLGPLVMGILNVTPDSFSDGGNRFTASTAIDAGLAMLAQGADIIDVGGESTRPGASVIPPDEECRRILPVIEALARQGAVISVDTRNATTMERALDAGARIVNDVSALCWDRNAAAAVARAGCSVILMHMRGTPETMKGLARYDDLVGEVVSELAARVAAAEAAGIARNRIAVDPGFGFAKTAEQNLVLIERLAALAALGLPVLAGISRKSTIGLLTGEPDARRRDAGSLAAHLACLDRGARVIRAHDVPGTRQAVAVWTALNGSPAPSGNAVSAA